jgi:hypothetical protein
MVYTVNYFKQGKPMTPTLAPPTAEEYAPFYSEYIERAKDKGDPLAVLPRQMDTLRSALGHLTEKQALYRFGVAEWSVKEVVGHLIDVERVFSYRLLRVSRNDATPLPGFEQDDYVRAVNFDNVPLADLLQEFEHLRRANVLSVNYLSDESISRRGTASGATVSARALIYMLVGHV